MTARVFKLLLFFALLTQVGNSFADNVTLAWNPSTDPNVVSYNLYYGALSRVYTGLVQAGPASSATVSNLIPLVTYYFAVTAIDVSGLESAYSDEVAYTVPQSILAPLVTLQPLNQTIVVGSNVQFQVSVSGTLPLSFQWVFNGNQIQGATTSTLNLTNVQLAQSGTYAVLVTNIAGATSSAPALLTVLVPPSITTQPADQAIVVGDNVTFTVTADGTAPLNYQWFFNATNLIATGSNTLNLTNAQSSQVGFYSVVVANVAGSTASRMALLTVLTPPFFSIQPLNQTVVVGSNVQFQVSAGGTPPLSYQWMFNGSPLGGATTGTLSLTNVQLTQSGTYAVLVTNIAGATPSAPALLTVQQPTIQQPPILTFQPSGQTVVVGSNAQFQVSAEGTTPLSYQWMFNGSPLGGATISTLNLTNVQLSQSGTYAVLVTNIVGATSSAPVLLTVVTPPSITTQPVDQTVVAGSDVTFSVAVDGTGALAYQWFFNGTNLIATGSTLSLTNVQPSQAGFYSVVVANVAGSITSSLAQLTVLMPPFFTLQPSSQTATIGSSVEFQSSAGGTPPLGYQWFLGGVPIPSETNSVLALTDLQPNQAGNYLVTVTNRAGSSTSQATLTILVPPTITKIVSDGATVSLSLDSVPGLEYELDYNDALNSGIWTSLSLPVLGTGTLITIQDTNASGSSRFYRIRCY